MTLPCFTSRSTGMKMEPSILVASSVVLNRAGGVQDWDCMYFNREVRRD